MRQSKHGAPAAIKLLAVPDVASSLGVSVRTVWRLIKRQELDVIYVGPKLPRVRSTDLERFVA